MSAAGFLKRVAQVLEDRGAAYGDPKNQMEAIARRWSITLGMPVTPQQVALCMIDLKLARIDAAITRWMGWAINRETAREIAMPKGLPYLKGFVLYFSLQAQIA